MNTLLMGNPAVHLRSLFVTARISAWFFAHGGSLCVPASVCRRPTQRNKPSFLSTVTCCPSASDSRLRADQVSRPTRTTPGDNGVTSLTTRPAFPTTFGSLRFAGSIVSVSLTVTMTADHRSRTTRRTATTVEWLPIQLASKRTQATVSRERSARDPTPHLLNENIPTLLAAVSCRSSWTRGRCRHKGILPLGCIVSQDSGFCPG